jgi:hypothetical protein
MTDARRPGPQGTRDLAADLNAQKEFFRERVPVYARLLELLMEEVPAWLGPALERAWSARAFPSWYERPLLLLGALRDDALREGERHPLWPAIGAGEPDIGSVTAGALARVLAPDRAGIWETLSTRHIQTNETSRAVAWLWPTRLYAESGAERPVALFDVGTSAGLNLVADRLAPVWAQVDGTALEVRPLPPIAERTGFDLRPMDVREERNARWLRACVWPGQLERVARLEEAIAAFRDLAGTPAGPRLVQCTASEIPARLPRSTTSGPRAIAFQTIMRDYMEAEELAAYEQGMEQWLGESAAGTALWMELEVVRSALPGGDPVNLTAHVRPRRGHSSAHLIASCEPHPRIVRVFPAAVDALKRALG